MQYDPDDLRQLQLVELEVLLAIDELCARYDIPYFLDSGSALGAMRNGGFIQWDDDIDIGMLREDYERFVAVALDELPEGYRLLTPDVTEGYAPMWAKVMREGTKFYTRETLEAGLDQGVFVDVFPYDRLCEDVREAQRQVADCLKWQRASYMYHAASVHVPHGGVLGRLERLMCGAAHGVLKLCTRQDILVAHFRNAISRDVAGDRVTVLSYPVEGGFAQDELLPARMVSFEGHELPVPRDAEGYLVKKYGERWMDVPPEGRRRNHAPEILELSRGTG